MNTDNVIAIGGIAAALAGFYFLSIYATKRADRVESPHGYFIDRERGILFRTPAHAAKAATAKFDAKAIDVDIASNKRNYIVKMEKGGASRNALVAISWKCDEKCLARISKLPAGAIDTVGVQWAN